MEDNTPLTMVEYLNVKIALEQDRAKELAEICHVSTFVTNGHGVQLDLCLARIDAFKEARAFALELQESK